MNQSGVNENTNSSGGIFSDGRANLPVCLNLTASKRSNAGGTIGMHVRTLLRSFWCKYGRRCCAALPWWGQDAPTL
jgi:hypothetical protein